MGLTEESILLFFSPAAEAAFMVSHTEVAEDYRESNRMAVQRASAMRFMASGLTLSTLRS